mmetsp:Transcript_25311/g.81594  ORF Transcript_25311/g.81594 Transcript_25311/m.81594 type:complete len:220 (-) Transcript_25311:160-819(-)
MCSSLPPPPAASPDVAAYSAASSSESSADRRRIAMDRGRGWELRARAASSDPDSAEDAPEARSPPGAPCPRPCPWRSSPAITDAATHARSTPRQRRISPSSSEQQISRARSCDSNCHGSLDPSAVSFKARAAAAAASATACLESVVAATACTERRCSLASIEFRRANLPRVTAAAAAVAGAPMRSPRARVRCSPLSGSTRNHRSSRTLYRSALAASSPV